MKDRSTVFRGGELSYLENAGFDKVFLNLPFSMVDKKKKRYTCINAACPLRANEEMIHKAISDLMSQQIAHVELGKLLFPLTS